jgi:DNA-directed RNA polymerase specialized sigma24 family protein
VSNQQTEFADFFQASWEPCLRAVVAVVGSPQLAEDQVAEAFARAWVSWRKVSRHPAPRAWVVRTALNTGASWWRRRRGELPLAEHDVTAPGDLDGGLDATAVYPPSFAGYPAASSAKCAPRPPAGTEACSPEVMSLTVTVPASSSVFP